MLKAGNSIVVVSSVIVELALIMVSYWLDTVEKSIGLSRIHGEAHGEKVDTLD
jgi:hypothetical protein